jgi:hypothetical protein
MMTVSQRSVEIDDECAVGCSRAGHLKPKEYHTSKLVHLISKFQKDLKPNDSLHEIQYREYLGRGHDPSSRVIRPM